MSGGQGVAPASVARLWALVERVAPRGEAAWEARPALRRGRMVSASRAKQLRALLGQLERAVGTGRMPSGAGDEVRVLLSPEGIDAFWELAAAGRLRNPRQPSRARRRLSWSQMATLRDCLKIVGEEAGMELVLPSVWRPDAAHLAKPVSPRQAAALYRRLADAAAGLPEGPGRERYRAALAARTVAAVAVILDTGMRSGDMVTRRLEDVDLDAGTLRAVHHPQNGSHMEVVEETLALREGTCVALRRWLVHRRELTVALEGADPGALWVTVHPSTTVRGGERVLYPAGMPLAARGFLHGYAQGVAWLNEELAGRWEGPGRWRPLPVTPERLRRSVAVEALRPWTPLSDGQWEAVAPLMPPGGYQGRAWADHRGVLDGIAWRFQTGGMWSRIPPGLPPTSTVVRRLGDWLADGTWDEVCAALVAEAGGDEGRVAWALEATRSRARLRPGGVPEVAGV